MNLVSSIMPFRLFVFSLMLLAAVFALELSMPQYALTSVGYIIIILYMLRFPEQSNYAFILGITSTLLIMVGYALTVSAFQDNPGAALTRALSILAIWLAVYFSRQYKNVLDEEVRVKERLHAVFNNATEGMLIVDKEGKIVQANRHAENLFGFDEGKLTGTLVDDLLPGPLKNTHRKHRYDFMVQPKNRPMGPGRALSAKRNDGSELPVEISLGYFNNQEGSFAVAFITDLSEQKRTQQKIIMEQERAHTYFELAPVLFVVLVRDGNVTTISTYGQELLGYAKEEIIGKNWFTNFLPAPLQEDLIAYAKKIMNAETDLMHHESAIINKQGIEIEMSWRYAVVKDSTGKVTGILAAGTDIRERKIQEKVTHAHHVAIQRLNNQLEERINHRTQKLNEAVEKLQASNRDLEKNQLLFSTIAHHLPDSVIGVLNKDMKYIFADGPELQNIGLRKFDNRGERVFDDLHPALSRDAEEKLKTVFQGNRVSYDVEIGNKTYTVSSVPRPDDLGQINDIIVVIRNITDRRKIEKELLKSVEREKELSEMKAKFVTMASHEFRTPLSTILSSVFLLENYTGTDLEQNKSAHLSKIKKSVNNLTDLLNDFISLGKLEEGRIKLNYSEINVHTFLQELIPEMELVRKSGQAIRCECAGEETGLLIDTQLLRSILVNLLGNAIKYSPENTEIKLTTVLTDHHLIIEVTDQGIGIPSDEQKHIFKRFYRAHNATNIEGTGLGLNIVKKYVKLMNGTIQFKSAVNQGTAFKVILPRISCVEENKVLTKINDL